MEATEGFIGSQRRSGSETRGRSVTEGISKVIDGLLDLTEL